MALALAVSLAPPRASDLAKLQGAIAALRSTLTAADAQSALSVLRSVLSNVVSQPEQAKYRSIRTANAAFQSKLGRHGAPVVDALTAAGFMLVERGDGERVWELQSHSHAMVGATHLQRCLAAVEAELAQFK